MKDVAAISINMFDWDSVSKTLVYRNKLPLSEPIPKWIVVKGEKYNIIFKHRNNNAYHYDSFFESDHSKAKGIKVILRWGI